MCRIRHGNNYARYPNPSKFNWKERQEDGAQEAIREGEALRKKIQGKRIFVRGECVDKERWELLNTFRL